MMLIDRLQLKGSFPRVLSPSCLPPFPRGLSFVPPRPFSRAPSLVGRHNKQTQRRLTSDVSSVEQFKPGGRWGAPRERGVHCRQDLVLQTGLNRRWSR